MPDISRCRNEACPMRHNCYRYMFDMDKDLHPREHWVFKPDAVTGECDKYLKWANRREIEGNG